MASDPEHINLTGDSRRLPQRQDWLARIQAVAAAAAGLTCLMFSEAAAGAKPARWSRRKKRRPHRGAVKIRTFSYV
ncbi:hypothetical protein BCCH1_81570 (plasmid) [Burkholderia contaminans]|uniref:Uncharacterized protein n=1 Tax=Burkholderia contaminans TaxID=488447 RepID=A0A250LM10_9BURK|nr:hypothetical protein BCCH1_76200 [Burkholderia contaminans]BBA45646.1 hypothetical protein BCCH1_81570 [Burkholderia contaminans]